MKIITQSTKTLKTRDNGRSADAIAPNLIYGCLGGCMKSYCYVGRFNHDKVYVNKNVAEILKSVEDWVETKPWPKTPNQTDKHFYTVDIGCSTDIALMQKHQADRLDEVFAFFTLNPKIKSTFATKYPSMFTPEKYKWIRHSRHKHRIRVSLMPQPFSDILEPNTDSIEERLKSIIRLQTRMETHINFSPIIFAPNWIEHYRELFIQMKEAGIGDIPCECIFLTHNEKQHERNAQPVRDLLWRPDIQESKDSQYAADNIRYKHVLKRDMVKQFVSLYSEFYNPSNIRYIF